MEPLIAAVKPYLSEGETYFFRPDKFIKKLDDLMEAKNKEIMTV